MPILPAVPRRRPWPPQPNLVPPRCMFLHTRSYRRPQRRKLFHTLLLLSSSDKQRRSQFRLSGYKPLKRLLNSATFSSFRPPLFAHVSAALRVIHSELSAARSTCFRSLKLMIHRTTNSETYSSSISSSSAFDPTQSLSSAVHVPSHAQLPSALARHVVPHALAPVVLLQVAA